MNNSWSVTFSPDDTINDRLKKAAHVKPSAAQIKWMEREYIAFMHYSPNTFTNRQWGTGQEDLTDYNPTAQDPGQWAKVCAEAGMRMIVPTVKHHDGFCQWHTKSTDFSVEYSPAKDDVVRMLSQACRKYNIDLGVYLSPWDMNQKHKGVFNTPKYQEVYMTQLRELMDSYGEINELWLDGACGDFEIWHKVKDYDPEEWYDYVEKAQPDCVIRLYDPHFFASEEEWQKIREGKKNLPWRGKEVRWVGNESGNSRENEWSVQPIYNRSFGREATYKDLGEEYYYKDAVGAVWYPVEVNTTLLNQWFWNEGTSHVRDLNDLINVFYNSFGNNGVLLLNVSPDNRGLIPDDQIKRLAELKQFIDGTFSNDLTAGGKSDADSEHPEHKAASVLDGNKHTYWTPGVDSWDIDSSTATIEISLGGMKTFDNVLVQEYIYEGQRVNLWTMSAFIDGNWVELTRKKIIGYKTIRRFDAVTSDRIRIQILRSWDTPMISRISLHLSQMPETEFIQKPQRVISLTPASVDENKLQTGLSYSYFDGGIQSAKVLGTDAGRVSEKTGDTSRISLDMADKPIGYSVIIKGYIYVPESSPVTFKLGNTDGCVLYINNRILLDNDEPHEYSEKTKRVQMNQGYYEIELKYTSFRNPGRLSVLWGANSDNLKPIESKNLFRTI